MRLADMAEVAGLVDFVCDREGVARVGDSAPEELNCLIIAAVAVVCGCPAMLAEQCG